jgi:MSHA pilin protein MshD
MKTETGMTLVELLLSVVIVGIAASTILGVFATTSASSADPMLRHQAAAIADSYLQEILARPYADPDGVDTETLRSEFDDIGDYDGLVDNGARDQFGNWIPALANYTVSVAVNSSSALSGVPGGDTYRIDVLVTEANNINFLLSGYRTR